MSAGQAGVPVMPDEIVVDYDAQTILVDGEPFPFQVARDELYAFPGAKASIPYVEVKVFAGAVKVRGTSPGERWRKEGALLAAQVADRRLAVVGALLGERGVPHDMFEDVGQRGVRPHLGDQGGTVAGDTLLPSGEFILFAHELLERARQVEQESAASGYRVGSSVSMLPVYRDAAPHESGFILTDVGQDVPARLFPCAFPAHVVDLGLSTLGARSDRIRFFSELTRIYSDAVRLSGQFVGLEADLLASLRQVAAVLRGLVRDARSAQAQDPEHDAGASADDPAGRSDPAE